MFKFNKRKEPEELKFVNNFMEALSVINNKNYIDKNNKNFKIVTSTAKPKEKIENEWFYEKVEERNDFEVNDYDTYCEFETDYSYDNTMRNVVDNLNPNLCFDVDRCFDVYAGYEIYNDFMDNNY